MAKRKNETEQPAVSAPRPKRQCREKAAVPAAPADTSRRDDRWSLHEKKAFLSALKLHGTADIEKIQKCLPSRSASSITNMIKRYKTHAKTLYDMKRRMRAPIEFWQCQAEFLTENIQDVSTSLAQVMSIAGNLEAHRLPKTSNEPDYNAIYGYLSELLKGQDPRKLNPTDACVVLRLFHDMANHLHSVDFSCQRALMLKKFDVLSESFDFEKMKTSHGAFIQMMKKLQEDPLANIMKKAVSSQRNSSNIKRGQQENRGIGERSEINQPGPSSVDTSQRNQSETAAQTASNQSQDTHLGSDQSEMTSQTESNQSERVQSDSYQSENRQQTASDQKGEGSSHQSENKSQSASNNQSEGSGEGLSHQSENLSQSASNQSGEGSSHQSENPSQSASDQSGEGSSKEEVYLPQRAPLYSLNPFCIPLKYLNPRQLYKICMMPTHPDAAVQGRASQSQARKKTSNQSTDQQSQTLGVPRHVITEAIERGLLKPGQQVKVKVVHHQGSVVKVIEAQGNKTVTFDKDKATDETEHEKQ